MVEASVHVPFAGVCVYCHIKVVLVVAVLTHVVHWFNPLGANDEFTRHLLLCT